MCQSHLQHRTTIDIKIADLMGKLSIENVVDLVLSSMRLLPETMPPSFQSVYTPILAAGSPYQIEYLARLLHEQISTSANELIDSQQVIIQCRNIRLIFYFSMLDYTVNVILKNKNSYQIQWMIDITTS